MSFYRKNYASGILSIAMTASPAYLDDPLYNEIAVDEEHSLPDSSEVDLTDRFRLVIWSDTIDPGNDPNMEIVTATRTAHPRVYQVVTRGEEDTAIVVHPVGSYVGLHYTAGVSTDDLSPILNMLKASKGSIVYVWTNIITGEKYIEVLPPGEYGQVLVTAGDNVRPFWDWVWQAPGGVGGFIILQWKEINSAVVSDIVVIDETKDLDLTDDFVAICGTDYGPNADWFYSIEVLGNYGSGEEFRVDIDTEILVFDGSSGNEEFVDLSLPATDLEAELTLT